MTTQQSNNLKLTKINVKISRCQDDKMSHSRITVLAVLSSIIISTRSYIYGLHSMVKDMML